MSRECPGSVSEVSRKSLGSSTWSAYRRIGEVKCVNVGSASPLCLRVPYLQGYRIQCGFSPVGGAVG